MILPDGKNHVQKGRIERDGDFSLDPISYTRHETAWAENIFTEIFTADTDDRHTLMIMMSPLHLLPGTVLRIRGDKPPVVHVITRKILSQNQGAGNLLPTERTEPKAKAAAGSQRVRSAA